MAKKLIYLYLFCLPLTSAFAITEVVSVCLILLAILSFAWAHEVFIGKSRIFISKTDGILLAFWVTAAISFVLNLDLYISNKPINHILAYSYVILGNYFLLKNIVFNKFIKGEITIDRITFYIGLGILITSIFGTFEFVGKNFFFLKIDEVIPRVAVQDYQPITSSIIRIRSFIEESGHLAFYYELLAPIGLYGLRKTKQLFYLTLITTAICFILTFSTAGWIIVIIIGAISSALYLFCRFQEIGQKTNLFPALKFLFVLSLLGLLCGFFYFSIAKEFIDSTIFLKISDSGSADDRTQRAVLGLKLLSDANPINLLIGHGPAAYDSLHTTTGFLILYQTFALETGLIGLFFFCTFLLCTLYQCLFIKDKVLRALTLCSITSGVLHFLFIGNYYYPWFWVIIIMSQVIKYNEQLSDHG